MLPQNWIKIHFSLCKLVILHDQHSWPQCENFYELNLMWKWDAIKFSLTESYVEMRSCLWVQQRFSRSIDCSICLVLFCISAHASIAYIGKCCWYCAKLTLACAASQIMSARQLERFAGLYSFGKVYVILVPQTPPSGILGAFYKTGLRVLFPAT